MPGDIVALGLAENLVDDPIAAEAQRAAAHFGYDPQATYIILTPPETIATGQPVYCGYHTQTTSVDGLGNPFRIQYAFIPWLNTNWPGVGTGGCGMHNVNATSDAFGNGIFDGYSIVTGHEYAEAVTDPDNFLPTRTAGTTSRAARTATSARGPTRRTSSSAPTSSRCSRCGATRPSTRPATAASSRASASPERAPFGEPSPFSGPGSRAARRCRRPRP